MANEGIRFAGEVTKGRHTGRAQTKIAKTTPCKETNPLQSKKNRRGSQHACVLGRRHEKTVRCHGPTRSHPTQRSRGLVLGTKGAPITRTGVWSTRRAGCLAAGEVAVASADGEDVAAADGEVAAAGIDRPAFAHRGGGFQKPGGAGDDCTHQRDAGEQNQIAVFFPNSHAGKNVGGRGWFRERSGTQNAAGKARSMEQEIKCALRNTAAGTIPALQRNVCGHGKRR